MRPAVHVVTLASADRAERVRLQRAALARWAPAADHTTVAIGERLFELDGSTVLDATAPGRLELARARNMAGDYAADAGAEVIVFLDADCLPGPRLIDRYTAALAERPDAVACGPVTYLREDQPVTAETLDALTGYRNPHPGRPAPADGVMQAAAEDEYQLFWSLSFALTARLWRDCREAFGGFSEDYRGYGGEDTDFGMQLRAHRIPMLWTGGADAFHQWHPPSHAAAGNREAIRANAALFHSRWGYWPMQDWL